MSRSMTDEQRREAIEHRDVLLNLRAILATASGQHFISYLFKNFDVGVLPEMGLDGAILMDRLGFLRAGQSVFDLVSEANADIAAKLLAEIKRERYAELYSTSEIGST